LPFKDPNVSFHDILEAITNIEKFTSGMDLDAFRADPKTVAAVERKLLQIAEAATRMGDDAGVACPEIPWRDVRGMGNWLRHRYDRVDLEIIWNTVTENLPPLKACILRSLNPPVDSNPAAPTSE
jgi:uncharacterized protein with HEPN domain